MRPKEQDLFAEEQTMPAMSFGEHIEELRFHLIRALIGLFVGMTIAFIPPLNLGQKVMKMMQDPAQKALNKFYTEQALRRETEANAKKVRTDPMQVEIDGEEFSKAMKALFPDLGTPDPKAVGEKVALTMTLRESDMIKGVARSIEPKSALISLAPLETFMIFFGVCIVTGLVISSPWVFREIWAFIAAGLYRHERHYVNKFLPFSLGLFLGGVFLCFFFVLPYTLEFLLDFNIWLGIEPTLRISEWISFATILPLVFGLCFQTPLVMMVIERIGIVSVADFRSKRRFAILIIVVVAAVITPTGDPFTLALLAVPMILLYELGILMVRDGSKKGVPTEV